jgi:hypothetical protein
MMDHDLLTHLIESLLEVRLSSLEDECVGGMSQVDCFQLNQPIWFLKIELGFKVLFRVRGTTL